MFWRIKDKMFLPIPIPLFLRRESEEDKQIRLKGKRLRELSRQAPTMERENKKRMAMGYPHLLEVVKEKCPKCDGKMWHDQFQKCWEFKNGIKYLKACYQCLDCKYRVLFNLFTNKFDSKPFGLDKTSKEKR